MIAAVPEPLEKALDSPMRPPPLRQFVEAARVAALCSYDLLDNRPEPRLDALCRAAATALEVPVALISVIDANQQWIKARVGSDLRQVPRHLSFCHYTIHEASGVLVVPDTLADPRFSVHPLVQDGPRYRFYAGVSIVDPGEYRIGTVSVLDSAPRHFDMAGVEVLQWLSAHAMDVLLANTPALKGFVEEPEVFGPAPQPASIRSWLGVRTERTGHRPDTGRSGLVVLSVARASPAERAGLAVGDVLVAIADHPTLEPRDVKLALSDRQVGDVVPVQLLRAGQTLQRSIQVEAMPRARQTRRRA